MMKRAFNTTNFWMAVLSVISLVWYHGFAHSSADHQLHVYWLVIALGYFVFQFAFRVYSSENPKRFLLFNWFEGTMYLVAIGFGSYFLLNQLGVWGSRTFITANMQRLSLHLVLLAVSGVEMIMASTRSTIWKLPVPVLLITSYVVIILAGSVILRLPMMLNDHVEPSYFQALFTSVSASCVTGLVTVNISDYYTLNGQFVIMVLIQLGGLNIVAFATYFVARFSRVDGDTLHGEAVKEVLTVDTVSGAKTLLQRIVAVALIIEGLGMVFIYHFSDYLNKGAERIFHSSFHAVSAFNNAGFTIIDGGLTNNAVSDLWSLHLSIAVLIILGGLGFATLVQLTGVFRSGGVSALSFNSRVSLTMAAILIGAGMVLFVLLESNTRTSGLGGLCQAFFQSVTARTAGFNTVAIDTLALPTLVLLMVLMFIGASPASTGGGLKTTTLFALISGSGKNRFSLSKPTFTKAKNLLVFGLVTVAVGTAIMSFTEKEFTLSQLLFEQVSAFGTVGLSTGITPHLGNVSLSVIMITMFIGRVGPLALVYSLFGPSGLHNRSEETLLIG